MNPPVHSSPLPRKGAFVLDRAYHIELRAFRWWLTIDRNFVFDGASIPRLCWTLIGVYPTHPKVQAAALVHDALYGTHYSTRAQADRVFYRLCRNDGMSRIRAGIMWAALRSFGWLAWRRSPTAIRRARMQVTVTTLPPDHGEQRPPDLTATTATATAEDVDRSGITSPTVAAVAILSMVLSGCVNLTVNLGGTVNNLSVIKSSEGDMTSGGNITDEANTNDGRLSLPMR